MPKKMTFEQVPVELIKKMVEEQAKQEETRRLTRGINKDGSKKTVPTKNGRNGRE